MGIGWRSTEGSDVLPNMSRGEYLGAHGSNKSNIQVVYHAQPITTSQLTLPAPNAEIAKEVANKAQSLIDQFGYYQFLNLVDFMQRNPGAVSFGLNLINKR